MKEVIKVRKEQKWKYTVDYKSMNLTSSGDTEKFLNKMGINGWELINIQKILDIKYGIVYKSAICIG